MGLIFFVIAILICISAFVARLNVPKMIRKGYTRLPSKYNDFDNLLSSIRAAYYKPKDYAEKLAIKLGMPDHQLTPIELDYVEHIIVNSKIVIYKFMCFRYATVCMLVGMICTVLVKFSGI